MLDSFTLWTVLLGTGVCFAAGLIGGLSGFGAGLLVTLFIPVLISTKALLPVISVLMLVNNASRVWFFRTDMDLRIVLKVAAAAVPMAFLGALLYVRLDSEAIQAMLGAVLIGSVPLRRWIRNKQIQPSNFGVVAVSGVYGFLSSVVVGAGMLIIPLLLGIGLAGPALLVTDAAIAVIVNLFKVIFFGGLDALSFDLFVLALLMGLCTIPGTATAAWLVRRTSIQLHTALIEALIIIGGLGFLVNAAMDVAENL